MTQPRPLGDDAHQLPLPEGQLTRRALRSLAEAVRQSDGGSLSPALIAAFTTSRARGLVAPLLLARLPSTADDPPTRAALVRAIAVTADEGDAAAVAAAFVDEDLGPGRAELATALVRLPGTEATQALAAGLDVDDLRVVVLRALRRRPRRGFVGRVRRLTRHPDEATRTAAARTLEALLDAAPPRARDGATNAVQRLRSGSGHTADVAPAAPQREVETGTPVPPSVPPRPSPDALPRTDPEYLSIPEGVWLWVKQSFATRSRAVASLGTLTLTASLLALWSRPEPNWVLAAVSLCLYAVAAGLLVHDRRRRAHLQESAAYPSREEEVGSRKITRPTYPG